MCHKKQSTKNRLCFSGIDLVKLKRYKKMNIEDTQKAVDQMQAYLASVDQNVDQEP